MEKHQMSLPLNDPYEVTNNNPSSPQVVNLTSDATVTFINNPNVADDNEMQHDHCCSNGDHSSQSSGGSAEDSQTKNGDKSDNGGENGSGGSGSSGGKVQVKPFTKKSLDRLENKTVQLVREYGFQPRRKLSVQDGSILPGKYEPFPKSLYGRPLEEIDNFIYDEVGAIRSRFQFHLIT